MRIWSLHPDALDRAAIIACWRETLLAQAVLAGSTKGYRQHPQLDRFRATPDPLATVGAYLTGLADDADRRGYRFDRNRILMPSAPSALLEVSLLEVTAGQLAYEWAHLGRKLEVRSPDDARRWEGTEARPHPLFVVVPGGIAPWERP